MNSCVWYLVIPHGMMALMIVTQLECGRSLPSGSVVTSGECQTVNIGSALSFGDNNRGSLV